MEKKKVNKNKRTFRQRFFRILGWSLGIILALFFLIVLFIRSSWGQDIVIQNAVKYVSNKTQSKIEVEKFFLTFEGNLVLKGLYLEDAKGDTLVYSRSVEANVPLLPILKGNGVAVDFLRWEGLKARVYRKDTLQDYNFQFLVDAFVSDDEPDQSQAIASENDESLNVVIGDVYFSDFDILFKDDVLGIDSHLQLGDLALEMRKTDLAAMDFRVSKFELRDTKASFIQSPAQWIVEDEDDSEMTLPYLEIDRFSLENVEAYYQSEDEQMIADLDIGQFLLELQKGDLKNNDFEIGTILLKDAVADIQMKETEALQPEAEEEVTESTPFEWPEMTVSIAKVAFEDNKLSYFVNDQKPQKGVFNADALVVDAMNMTLRDIYLRDQSAGLDLKELSFIEASGFNLKKTVLQLAVTEKQLELNGLDFQLNNNVLQGETKLSYASINALMTSPDKTKLALDIPKFQVDVNDAFRFQPELRNNEYVDALRRKNLAGNLKLSGSLATLDIPKAELLWGNSTQIQVKGKVENPTDMDRLRLTIPTFTARTTRDDLLRFVDESEFDIGLPENVLLTGYAIGDMEDIRAKAELNTTQGLAVVEGTFRNKEKLEFEADLEVVYQLGQLLKSEDLGVLGLSIKTSGSGKTVNDLNALLDAKIDSLQLGDYMLRDLSLTGNIVDGAGDILSRYKDKSVDVELDAYVALDSVAPLADVFLNVKGINFQSLGLMDRDVRTSLKLDVNFSGSKDGFDVISTMGDAVVVHDDKTYMLGDMLATAYVRSDTTSIWLDNRILQFSIESNAEPATFGKAIQEHVSSYFSRQIVEPDSTETPIKLKMIGRVAQAPVLNQVFLMNVQELDTIKYGAYFDQSARRLIAEIHAPHVNYSGNTMDSLVFAMDTDREKFMFDLRFKNIKAGPLDIPPTRIRGNQKDNIMNMVFHAQHNDSTLINVQSQISGTFEELRFRVLPEDLIFDRKPWEIPEDNQIVWTPDSIHIDNFRISRNNETVWLTDALPAIDTTHVGVAFQNFSITEILSYLNPEEELAKGRLNGALAVINPMDEIGLKGKLILEQLNLLDSDLGTMTITAASDKPNRYDFQVAMKEGMVDLDLDGSYQIDGDVGIPDIDLRINEVKMQILESLSGGAVRDGKGIVSGKFGLSGTTEDLKYKGNLNFKEAEFNIAALNATFGLPMEVVRFDNDGITLRRFTILDGNSNALMISGKIGTENPINPTFDLTIDTDDFHVLNATEKDNKYLYGVLSFDAKGTLKGDLSIPKLDMTLHIDNDTDVTYVLPTATVGIEERDGVVMFVNREDPEAVLTKVKEKTARVSGFDVALLLKIGEEAKATIVLDEESEDNFYVYGAGDLNFTMNPNGRMNLTGLYDIRGGHYELNLYGLVKRKFELAEGSKVTWAGDLFDAKMDIRALYRLETSASSLMAPVSSGSDPAERGKFRQVLPFDVFINIGGNLEGPEIAFDLDMPEDQQGAIGGQVYGRIQQVNQQEDELNRQVFSLLVLNRFYPDPGSDGSEGGVASIARDNLNDAISDQLNILSDKLLGKTGFELDFGLDSFTDYQGDSPEQRTQLDIAAQKKLFNDRLIVRVGSEVDIEGKSNSNESTPIIGNVSVEYLLTPNGRYRLKGFRKNSYENVIDGQTIVSGFSVIFTQEFNEFDELWQALLRGETNQERAARRAEAMKQRIKEIRDKRRQRAKNRMDEKGEGLKESKRNENWRPSRDKN